MENLQHKSYQHLILLHFVTLKLPKTRENKRKLPGVLGDTWNWDCKSYEQEMFLQSILLISTLSIKKNEKKQQHIDRAFQIANGMQVVCKHLRVSFWAWISRINSH